MTPINEVPIGKFCSIDGNVLYVIKNNFKDSYTLAPVIGTVSRKMKFGRKVYVYKQIDKNWIPATEEWVEFMFKQNMMDNLSYIENLAILKSYEL
jgi:hypothetical protein